MKLTEAESYISFDVETTGPVPGLYSMIDLGACLVTDSSVEFQASLQEAPDAGWEKGAREFWMRNGHNRRILTQIQERAESPMVVMSRFDQWLKQFGKPVMIGFPASFDFSFINYYWWRWLKKDPPFSFSCLDVKTMAMCVLKSGYRDASKSVLRRRAPQCFTHNLEHTHLAIDDAKEQAFLFQELVKLV